MPVKDLTNAEQNTSSIRDRLLYNILPTMKLQNYTTLAIDVCISMQHSNV